MRIKTLRLYQYRNLADQELEFRPGVIAVIGQNGQGKTNLLESIYLLAQAKSFRRSKPVELLRWEIDPSRSKHALAVAGEVESGDGEKTIRVSVENNRIQVEINGKRTTQASRFYGQLRVVLFTPDDILLIKGEPLLRRQFVDRTIAMIDPIFVDHLVSYERAVKSRNRELKSYLKERIENRNIAHLRQLLDPWNEVLIDHGGHIARQRMQFVAFLEKPFQLHYEYLANTGKRPMSPENLELASVSYRSHFIENGALLSHLRLKELFDTSLLKDAQTGQTSFGVHRDDLPISLETAYGEHSAKGSASQGQARSLVLALKFASLDFLEHAEGEQPVLLLDDVDSELDPLRRKALYQLLSNRKNQILITGTELSPELKAEKKHLQTFLISDGKIES